MTRTVGTIGAAGGFLILILEIISLATPNWIETGTRSVGLWKVCGAVIRCFDFSDGVPDFYKVAQVFMVIGCILLTSAVGISVVVMLGKGSKSMPVFIIAMFSAAAIIILIALATFTAKIDRGVSGLTYGYSFYLGWVSFALSLILSFTLVVLHKSN